MNWLKDNFLNKTLKTPWLWFALFIGIFLRFFVMMFGHNFDFESYCIVGEIAGNFKNVYAHTDRYNYGFIFFVIQGLFWNISMLAAQYHLVLYRILFVILLTCTDIGIANYLRKHYSSMIAVVFFLNPISIVISGFHNQFDNIAVLVALLALPHYNKKKEFTKDDFWFILFMSLSLIIKHIFFMIPFFLLVKKGLPLCKRVAYSFIPPIMFLLNFVPFIIGNDDAWNNVLNNVFLYRSNTNSPLLWPLYQLFNIPTTVCFPVYIAALVLIALLFRKRTFENIFFNYTICMFAFASAIANQYLVIPIVAACVLDKTKLKYLYFVEGLGFVLLNFNEFNLAIHFENVLPPYLYHLILAPEPTFFIMTATMFAIFIINNIHYHNEAIV